MPVFEPLFAAQSLLSQNLIMIPLLPESETLCILQPPPAGQLFDSQLKTDAAKIASTITLFIIFFSSSYKKFTKNDVLSLLPVVL
jgi:hypothetical protein